MPIRRKPTSQTPRPRSPAVSLDAGLTSAVSGYAEMYLRKAELALERTLEMPELRFDLRGAAAGMAYPGANLIRLNAVLLVENPDAFMNDVLPHEMAHLIVAVHWKRRQQPHGRQWQWVMQEVFGIEPSRTHAFDISRASPRPHRYSCDCDGTVHQISTRMHNDIQRGRSRICRHCRGTLNPLA